MKATGTYPRTVAEAVDRLMGELTILKREEIAGMEEDDLIELHFGLGQYICNSFGLWQDNDELMEACGVDHGDDCSEVIIRALWERLRD